MKNKKSIIVGIIGILLIIFGVYLNFYSGNKSSASTEVFMIKNNSKKYALFNNSGEQLSDFLYEGEYFEHKHLLVLYSKDGGAIYNKQGKKLYSGKEVDWYKVIGSFYFNRSDMDSHIYNYQGKKLKSYKPKDMEIIAFADNYILIESKNELKIFTEKEEFITVFKNETIDKDIKVLESEKLVVINNNGTNYVVDIEKKKMIHKIENPNLPVVTAKSNDNYIYGFLNSEETIYYYYNSHEILYELKERICSLNDLNDKIICYSDDKNQSGIILNEKGESYALINPDNTVSIFYNSKLQKTVSGTLESKTNYSGIYTIVKEEAGVKAYSFYNLKGEEILTEQKYDYAGSFNSLGQLVVAKDAKYFLIDKNAKKISDDYLHLINNERNGNIYYIANENTDKERYILNDKAKEIYKTKSKEIEVEIVDGQLLILASETNSKKLDLINPRLGLVIKDEILSIKNNYIEVDKKETYNYYTFEGKLITSTKK